LAGRVESSYGYRHAPLKRMDGGLSNMQMRKLVAVLGVLAVAGLLFVQAANAGEKENGKKTHEMTVTVVSVDTSANTITVKNEKGEEQTAPVLPKARASLADLKAGEMIVVTCLDNEKGEHQGVTMIKPAKSK